jgi:hypothetical protein
MANDKSFKIKNGLSAGRYLGSNGTETAGSEGYSLAGASYDSKSFSVASQASVPTDMQIKTDGTKIYVFNRNSTSSAIYQYSLSTPFDVSTASYDSVSLVLNKSAQSYGCFIDSTGTYVYHITSTGVIYQYSMTTAWDLSTASYDSKTITLSAQDTSTVGLYLGDSGTNLYIMGATGSAVYQYTLSTAYDITTATYASKSLSVSGQSGSSQGVWLSESGLYLFYMGYSNTSIYKYTLSTAWDLATATYSDEVLNVSSHGQYHFGLCFTATGDKLYVPSLWYSTIFQYSTVQTTNTLDLATGGTFSFTPSGATTVSFTNPPASGTATGFALEVVNTGGYALTWPSSVKWHLGAAPTATATKELYTFVTTDGGTTYYGKLAGSDIA